MTSKHTAEVMRQKAQSVTESFLVPLGPEQVWPFVSNTDTLNATIGLQAPAYRFEPADGGGTQMLVDTKEMIFDLCYQELPYEWLAPNWFKVERFFDSGALEYLSFQVRLKGIGTRDTQVTVTLLYVPKLPGAVVGPIIKANLAKIKAAYLQFADQAQLQPKHANHPWGALLSPSADAALKSRQLAQQWKPLLPESEIPERVADFVFQAPERYVHQLRPFELARLYRLDRFQMLHFFLRAAKAGWLIPKWELLCTHCRGPKVETRRLQDVLTRAHCESCGIEFEVTSDLNLEMTFEPRADLRPTQAKSFCAGGPANTPQFVGQFNLWPQDRQLVKLELPPGTYRLISLALAEALEFSLVEECEAESCVVDMREAFVGLDDEPVLGWGSELTLVNDRPHFLTCRIESLAAREQIVSAAQLAALQEFRDLFAAEQLNQALPIAHQVFLAAMPLPEPETGEPASQQTLLESLARDHEGASVGVYDQRLLFAFPNEALALKAGAVMLNEATQLLEMLEDQSWNFALTLHAGSCVLSSRGQQLSYSGPAVDATLRLLDINQPGYLLITLPALMSAAVQDFLSLNEEVLVEEAQLEDQDLQAFAFRLYPHEN